MGNTTLSQAKKSKNDEFYTRLTDIEKELVHYRHHFKDKVVLCNCDDPFESNFFKYFVLNFNVLGLKKLITTCYGTSPIANEQISLFEISGDERQKGRPYKAIVNKVCDTTGDGGIDMQDVINLFKMRENELIELKGNGDFRSDECIEMLKEADIVVTNPPFSLFRDYVAQLFEYNKQFVIIGNKNAITYKEIFPLFQSNSLWLGKMVPSDFIVPGGELSGKLGGLTRWFTNLDIKKRHEDIILVKKYNEEDYPKYDNYDAIEVNRVANIPVDYIQEKQVSQEEYEKLVAEGFYVEVLEISEGGVLTIIIKNPVMGVPITFLDNYNPHQFEIIGSRRWAKSKALLLMYKGKNPEPENDKKTLIKGKETYDRIFIRLKSISES